LAAPATGSTQCQAVRVEVTVAGPESAERYAELAAAVDEHCPVLDLFKNPVPVTRTIATEVTSS
jgi:putative redox protein